MQGLTTVVVTRAEKLPLLRLLHSLSPGLFPQPLLNSIFGESRASTREPLMVAAAAGQSMI